MTTSPKRRTRVKHMKRQPKKKPINSHSKSPLRGPRKSLPSLKTIKTITTIKRRMMAKCKIMLRKLNKRKRTHLLSRATTVDRKRLISNNHLHLLKLLQKYSKMMLIDRARMVTLMPRVPPLKIINQNRTNLYTNRRRTRRKRMRWSNKRISSSQLNQFKNLFKSLFKNLLKSLFKNLYRNPLLSQYRK
jgi:hypothetical protein